MHFNTVVVIIYLINLSLLLKVTIYLLSKNEVPAVNINGPWHMILDHKTETIDQYLALDRKMTHFITKKFEWHYKTE